MINRLFTSVVLAVLVFVLPVTAQDDDLQIVASHSILGDVVMQVAGDQAMVSVTMDAGVDPHGFQPVPGDLAQLADADVVFVNGAFFEEGLLEAIENAGSGMMIVEASACAYVLPFDEDGHEHDEDHSAEDHDDSNIDYEELCEAHTSELAMRDVVQEAPSITLGQLYTVDCDAGCDPHVWMNPYNVMLWTVLIRDTLMEIDPDQAEIYQENANVYLDQLERLVPDIIDPAINQVPAENRILITNHDTLAYFADAFDFEIAQTILPASTLAEPGTADIVAVIELVRELGIKAIFSETTLNNDIASQIANETGASIYTLYSGSLSEADGPAPTYIEYMQYNVTTIAGALQPE